MCVRLGLKFPSDHEERFTRVPGVDSIQASRFPIPEEREPFPSRQSIRDQGRILVLERPTVPLSPVVIGLRIGREGTEEETVMCVC